jgi:hypothetical protein
MRSTAVGIVQRKLAGRAIQLSKPGLSLRGFHRVTWLLVVMILAGAEARPAVFSADAVKAAFLYRFASYVEWPADAPTGRLVIAVAGAEEVASQLDLMLPSVTIHGERPELRRVSRASELDGAHILYVGRGTGARARALLASAVKRPILIVSDGESGLESGAVINFLESGRNVRFEISLRAADRARLKIDSSLLSVAARVERRPQAWSPCADPYVTLYRKSGCVIRTAAIDLEVPR